MENQNAKKSTNWEMNAKQKQFIEILKKNPDGITLLEIEIKYGIKFATGCINPLSAKGITNAEEKKDLVCDIVYNGVVVGHTTKKLTIYKLAKEVA